MLWITILKPHIIPIMPEILFWNECKKTLERDLPLEEYSTWIAPLRLKENIGITPRSYSVLAPNNFILEWVEENYGSSIKERLIAITSENELNLNFEVSQDEAIDTYGQIKNPTEAQNTHEESKKTLK